MYFIGNEPTESWMGCEGNKADIDVFAEADEVERLLNEKVIDKKLVINHVAYFETIYESGKLEAVAYKDQLSLNFPNLIKSSMTDL